MAAQICIGASATAKLYAIAFSALSKRIAALVAKLTLTVFAVVRAVSTDQALAFFAKRMTKIVAIAMLKFSAETGDAGVVLQSPLSVGRDNVAQGFHFNVLAFLRNRCLFFCIA